MIFQICLCLVGFILGLAYPLGRALLYMILIDVFVAVVCTLMGVQPWKY